MLLELYRQGNYKAVIASDKAQPVDAEIDLLGAIVVAASHLEAGNHREALARCERLAPLCTHEIHFVKLYASTLRRCGDLDKAASIYEEGFKHFKPDKELKRNYDNLLRELDARDAVPSKSSTGQEEKCNSLRIRGDHAGDLAHQQETTVRRLPNDKNEGRNRFSTSTLGWADPLGAAFSIREVASNQEKRRIRDKAKHNREFPSPPTHNAKCATLELLDAARYAILDKNPAVAISFCEEAIAAGLLDDYDAGRANELMGESYLSQGKLGAAELHFMLSLELQGSTAASLINLTSLACARRDVLLAKRRYQQCIAHPVAEEHLQELREQLKKIGLDCDG